MVVQLRCRSVFRTCWCHPVPLPLPNVTGTTHKTTRFPPQTHLGMCDRSIYLTIFAAWQTPKPKIFDDLIYWVVSPILLLSPTTMASFHHITPHQTVSIPVRFGKILSDEPWMPGFHWKGPLTECVDMFTGPDRDEVAYTCGTNDGVRFEGRVVITNELQVEHAVSAYRQFGKNPDEQNVYDLGEFFMQSICANMTAREFYVDNFDILDDLLEAKLVDAQKPRFDKDGTMTRPATGIRIVEGKVKVFKPQPINSNIDELIKKEAEHQQAVRTAKEERKVDAAVAENLAARQSAELDRERERNQQIEQRKTDTLRAELERAQAELEAEKKRLETQLEMERARAQKDANVTLTTAKASADALEIEAVANEKLLTEKYLKAKAIDAFYHNNKLVMGDSIPDAWINQAEHLLN